MKKQWLWIGVTGVAVIAAVCIAFIKQHGGGWQWSNNHAEDEVYSAASDPYNSFVTPNGQTAQLEPAGVAKPLRLFAVKVGASAKQGLAVLGPAESSSRTYVAGALLENGATLSDLYSDHVALTRDGKTYTLYLPQKGKSNELAAKSTSGLTVGGFKQAAPILTPPAVRVSDAIRVAPAFDHDQIVGYQIYPGTKAGEMEKWGLQNGDVLISLSGQTLNTAEQVESAMEQLAQGASIQGVVRRGKEKINVTLDGSTLASLTSNAAPPVP